jgi:hypothetical protein
MLLREMDEDIAQFADFPVVYPILEDDFVARDGSVPDGFRQLSARNRFYRIEFPVNLFPRSSWSFDRLEVRIEFNRGDVASLRPKAFQVFPNRQVAELAKGTYGATVRVTSDLTFAVDTSPVTSALPMPVAGAASAGAGAKLNLALGPFEYRVTRMVVETSAVGLEKVGWRFDDPNLLRDDPPRLIVITQVPSAATAVRVECALQAYRNYNFLADRVRNTLRELPKAIHGWFQNGAPLDDEATYDLTAECAAS